MERGKNSRSRTRRLRETRYSRRVIDLHGNFDHPHASPSTAYRCIGSSSLHSPKKIVLNIASQRFVGEFGASDFRHREPLVSGIRDGHIKLSTVCEDSNQQASAYSNIYEFRLRRLDSRPDTEHTRTLRSDVAALCEGLKSDPGDPCDLWIFVEPPYFIYSIFVSRRSRKVCGCVRGVDDRLITDEIKRDLWGEPKASDEP